MTTVNIVSDGASKVVNVAMEGPKGDKGDTGDITPELQALGDAASADAARAVDARIAAEGFANAASIAQTEIAAVITLYADTTAGLAATSSGQYFRVAGDNANTYTLLYLNSAGVAVLVSSVPSKLLIDAFLTALNPLRKIEPVNGIYPLSVFGGDKVMLGADLSVPGQEVLVGAFPVNTVDLVALWAAINANKADLDTIKAAVAFRLMQIDPPGDILPGMVVGNKIVWGYDTVKEELVGAFPAALTAAAGNASGCKALAWNAIIGYGQSLSVGAQSLPLLSTAQPYSNLTFNAGPRSTGPAGFNPGLTTTKALVEDTNANYSGFTNPGETPCSGAANSFSQCVAARAGLDPASAIVLASTAGHGGYRIDELRKASSWYPLLMEHVQAGFDLAPGTYACNVIVWVQGEADAIAGTTAASYLAALLELQRDLHADIAAITGQASPVYLVVMQTTHLATTAGGDILQAQYDAAAATDEIIIASPMYHLARYADNIHLTNSSSRRVGAMVGNVAASLIGEGVIPQKWRCVSAVARGTALRVKFNAPVLPLLLDTTDLAATTDHGFKVVDGTGTLTLSAIAVDGDDEVVITLNRALGSAPKLRYARDYMAAGGPSIDGGASGNLRDSNAATVTLDGTEVPLWTPCPAFETAIIKLS